MTTSGPGPLPLVGYADRLSAGPGETIGFKVSSRSAAPFEARLVRVICGDPNPAGPGLKEAPIPADFEGSWPSRAQEAHLGSYVRVDGARPAGGPVTVVATVWPTLPERGEQGIVSWLAEGSGLALILDGERGIVLRAGAADGGVEEAATGKPLRPRVWYRVWASVDPESGTMCAGQAALRPTPVADDTGETRRRVGGRGGRGALSTGGAGPIFIAAGGGDPVRGHFNGKIERPYVIAGAGAGAEPGGAPPPREPRPAAAIAADWDFSREIPSPST